MLSDVMEHFGLRKSLHQVDFFETDHHRQLLKDLKATIHEGGIVALTVCFRQACVICEASSVYSVSKHTI